MRKKNWQYILVSLSCVFQLELKLVQNLYSAILLSLSVRNDVDNAIFPFELKSPQVYRLPSSVCHFIETVRPEEYAHNLDDTFNHFSYPFHMCDWFHIKFTTTTSGLQFLDTNNWLLYIIFIMWIWNEFYAFRFIGKNRFSTKIFRFKIGTAVWKSH